MHRAFREGFEKEAVAYHDPGNRVTLHGGDRTPGAPSGPRRRRGTHFDWRTFGAFTGAGALGGLADALVSSKPSLRRGMALVGIGSLAGAIEGTQLGEDASKKLRAAKSLAGAGLGGATAFAMGSELPMKKRLIATGLGAAAAGLTGAL